MKVLKEILFVGLVAVVLLWIGTLTIVGLALTGAKAFVGWVLEG